MDGNFTDNNIDSIIETASVLPEAAPTSKSAGGGFASKYDKFRMRLKFSAGLDPESVDISSAVLSTGRKQVKTDVEYDKKRHSIIISPKSKYLRDTLYVLKVSGKIMSARGRSLRENRFFVFKQDGESVSFYRNIKPKYTGTAPDVLPARTEAAIPALFTVSALTLVGSYFWGSKLGLAIGTVLVLVATFFAFADSISDVGKSYREYVYGAKLYNRGFFFEAIECFELALHYNPNNHYAKNGLDAAIIKLRDE